MSKRRAPYEHTTAALAELLGRSEPGSYLPSEPRLAQQLGVSRATLREALRGFAERGWIERRQGVGTLVRPRVIEAGLEELVSLERLAQRIGVQVSMGHAEFTRRGDQLEIARVILTDDRPVAYLIDVVKEGLFSKAELQRDFRGSVLDLLRKRGAPELDFSKTEITAVSAEATVAEQLGVASGTVLLCLEGRLYDRAGRVIDRSKSYFLPDTFRFHVLRRVAPGAN